MKKIVAFIFVIVLLACTDVHKSPKPTNLIEKDKMVNIMYDIRLISAARSKNYKKLKDSAVFTDAYIYHKYQIDSLTFRQNLDYYATQSFKEFKDIEHSVKLRLDINKKKVQNEIKRKDSLEKPKEKKTKIKEGAILKRDKEPVFKSEAYPKKEKDSLK